MKTIAGISDVYDEEQIARYVNAGVDEFFIGYVPPEWSQVYGWEVSCNRREYAKYQYTTLKDLENIVGLLKKYNRKVLLAFNAHEFSLEQSDVVIKMLDSIKHVPYDAIIIANFALMVELRKNGYSKEINISIGSGCNNFENISFHYNNIDNIGRVILPRHLSKNEMESISIKAKKAGIKLEAFGLGGMCYFNDEHCFSWHSSRNRSFCTSPMYNFRETSPILTEKTWKKELNTKQLETYIDKKVKTLQHIAKQKEKNNFVVKPDSNPIKAQYWMAKMDKCGLCMFQKFKEWGIDTVKLPLRGFHLDENIELINIATKVINEPNATPDFCKDLLGSPTYCSGHNCYYNYPYA
jgi:collagenase-like PrtC family protease